MEQPEVIAIVAVGKLRDNGISNHSSEYENIGSFHNLSKFRALYFLKLCISRGTLMHSRPTKSWARTFQTTTGTLLARRPRASSLLVWLNMRFPYEERNKLQSLQRGRADLHGGADFMDSSISCMTEN